MERDEVVPRERLEGGLRLVAVHVEVVAVGEEERSRASIAGGRVVPLLHLREELLLAELEPVLLERGLGQDLAEDREPLVEVLREEVQRDDAAVVGRAAAPGARRPIGLSWAARKASRSSSSSAVRFFVPPRERR